MRRRVCGLLLLLSSVGGSAALSTEPEICDQPEPCFQAAALPKERLGKGWTKEQVLTLKLERLQRLIERFPDTVWA
jgi:soluble lytic murein transglycosylase